MLNCIASICSQETRSGDHCVCGVWLFVMSNVYLIYTTDLLLIGLIVMKIDKVQVNVH